MFETSKLSNEKIDTYVGAINEMSKCYAINCYNAAISLCGKIIEIYLTDLLTQFKIKIELLINGRTITDLTLGQLYRLTEKLPKEEKNNYSNNHIIELIRSFRNGTAHYNENIPVPSVDQTEGIISFTLDILKRRIASNW